MVAIALPCCGSSAVVSQSATRYGFLGNLRNDFNATEANRRTTFRHATTLSRFGLRISANGITSSSTGRVRINGANGNQVVTITASTTGYFEDTSNTDSVAAGDVVSCSCVGGSGGTNLTIFGTNIVSSAATNTVSVLGSSLATAQASASTTSFLPLSGVGLISTIEADCLLYASHALTLKNAYVYVSANTRSDATTIKSYINSADGNVNFSITASTTGVFEDTSNSDSLSPGDYFCLSSTTGAGTGSVTIQHAKVELESTTGEAQIFASTSVNSTINAGLVRYSGIGGSGGPATTESATQIKAGTSATYEKLTIEVVGNTVSATSTARFRKNTANGNQSISIAAGATGVFEDSSNTDSVVDSDLINISITVGSGGTSLIYRWFSVGVQATVTPSASGARNLTRWWGT